MFFSLYATMTGLAPEQRRAIEDSAAARGITCIQPSGEGSLIVPLDGRGTEFSLPFEAEPQIPIHFAVAPALPPDGRSMFPSFWTHDGEAVRPFFTLPDTDKAANVSLYETPVYVVYLVLDSFEMSDLSTTVYIDLLSYDRDGGMISLHRQPLFEGTLTEILVKGRLHVSAGLQQAAAGFFDQVKQLVAEMAAMPL